MEGGFGAGFFRGVRKRAESDARTYGYYLHPDSDFLQDLLEGLMKNWERYGYPSCPCRLASGVFDYDRDIFCPCDYRDPDVLEFGACYCALYVSKDVYEGKVELEPIPERRPIEKQSIAYASASTVSGAKPEVKPLEATSEEEPAKRAMKAREAANIIPEIKKKLFYCKQCGYVVYRDDPPYICPICKAKREMFAEIDLEIKIIEQLFSN